MADKIESFVTRWNLSIPTYKLSTPILKNPNVNMMIDSSTAVLEIIGIKPKVQEVDSDGYDLVSAARDVCFNIVRICKNVSADINVCLNDILNPTHKRCFSILLVLHNYALFCQMCKDNVNEKVSKDMASMREGDLRRKETIETLHNLKIENGQLQSNLERSEKKIPTADEKIKLQFERKEVEQDLEMCLRTKQKLEDQKRNILDKTYELTDAIKFAEELESDISHIERSHEKIKIKLEQAKNEVRLNQLNLRTLKQEDEEEQKRLRRFEAVEEAKLKCLNYLKTYDSLNEVPAVFSYIKGCVVSQEGELITDKKTLTNKLNERKELNMKININLKAEKQKINMLKSKSDHLIEDSSELLQELAILEKKISDEEKIIEVLLDYPEFIASHFKRLKDLTEMKAIEVEEEPEKKN